MQQFFKAISLVIVIACFTRCNSAQSEAQKQAGLIQKAVKEATPGSVTTSEDGYYMKAKIDGKEWQAAYMMPDESTNSSYLRISGENNGVSITFTLSARSLKTGKMDAFSESHAVDFSTNEEGGIFGGTKGEVLITNSDGKWVEGKFYFTATTSRLATVHEVTEGVFRVPFPAQNANAAY